MYLVDRIMNKYIDSQVAKKKIVVPLASDGALIPGEITEIPLVKGKCPFGTESKTYLRKGNSRNLLVFFNGGGVTWNEETCNYPLNFHTFLNGTAMYSASMEQIGIFGSFLMPKEFGAMDTDPSKNPFYDWNLAFLQYGTGDLHLGEGTYTFTNNKGKEETLYFNGYTVACEALDKAQEFFPDPEKILIVGGSAGAFGCSIMAGEVAKRFPNCENVTMFCDSALLIRDDWKDIAKNVWHSPEYITEAIKSEDITADFLEYLYENYGDRIKILYSQSIHDAILAKFQNYMNTKQLKYSEESAKFIREHTAKRVERLKEKCPNIHYYITDFPFAIGKGTEHCVLASKSWYAGKIEGVSPSEWTVKAIDGELFDVGVGLLK